MRVYLDLCTIQRLFDGESQQRVREEKDALERMLEWIDQGKLTLVTSYALEYESEKATDEEKRDWTETVLRRASERIESSPAIQRRTIVYMLGGLTTWDAAHLAAAVEARVEFFCTCDKKLFRRAKVEDTGLTRTVSPLELIKEVER
jgi:predicted nucleic acid-binding protein